MKTIILQLRIAALIVVSAFVFTACDKEEIMHHKLAGMWEINSITCTYYVNGIQDSTAVTSDAGVLKLWDNHSANNNIAEYQFYKPAPISIYDVSTSSSGLDPQGGTCWWFAGPGSTDRLTLWTNSPMVDDFVIYTVTKLKRSKMTLTYVKTDNQGKLSVKEVWKLEAY